MSNIFIPVKTERISPSEYLLAVKSERANIEKSTFIPPKLGDGSFGKFEVTYRFAKLRPANAA